MTADHTPTTAWKTPPRDPLPLPPPPPPAPRRFSASVAIPVFVPCLPLSIPHSQPHHAQGDFSGPTLDVCPTSPLIRTVNTPAPSNSCTPPIWETLLHPSYVYQLLRARKKIGASRSLRSTHAYSYDTLKYVDCCSKYFQ